MILRLTMSIDIQEFILLANRSSDKLVFDRRISYTNIENVGLQMQFNKNIWYYDRRDIRKPEERCVLWMICLSDTFENFFKQNYYQMLFLDRLLQPLTWCLIL